MCTCSFTRVQESRSPSRCIYWLASNPWGTIFSLLNQRHLTAGAVSLNLGNMLRIIMIHALWLAFLCQPPCARLLSGGMEMKKKEQASIMPGAPMHECERVEWFPLPDQQFIEFGARPGKQQATAIPCPGLNRSRRIAGFSMGWRF